MPFSKCKRENLLTLTWLLVVVTVKSTWTFNIETDYFVTHRGPIDSKFGFSLAQHKNAEGSWVLVGAPEAETQNPGVTKGGAVYKCHTRIEDHCEIVLFDRKGNHHDGDQFMDDKSHQWFGATVTSRGGIVAACAPRYVWYSVKKNRREPIGECFLMTSDKGEGEFMAYRPCMTNSWGYHRQGTCQAGFGLALSQSGEKLYVGAAGSWYWQGQVFYQNLLNMEQQLSTSEGPAEFDMSYMGFTLAMGHFDGDENEDVAVGAPRGYDLKGMVVLFNHNLEVLYNLTGDQIGSYFGYSIAVLDWDGDGFDDVAVGAPWHSQGAPSILFEEGTVVLFKHAPQHNFQRNQQLFGRKSRSHFGLSLTSLKDINGDGFEDLAVGAPRDGPEGKGGVYIFLGSSSGIHEKPTQVLLIEELTKVPIRTFGWSLSGGLDLDGNEYPDLAVGAHESNRAIVFRTRPVVTVNATVKIQSESGRFDLETLACSLQDNTDVPCYPIHYCLLYTGKRVPPRMDLYYSVRLDAYSSPKEPSSRLFFLKNEGVAAFNSSITLHKDVQSCKSMFIYASPTLHDKLTPLVTELSFALGTPEEYVDPLELRPILAPPPLWGNNSVTDVFYFLNNCGLDDICVPDLVVNMTVKEPYYVLGSSKTLVVEVHVKNIGEDAYGSRTFIRIPKGLLFNKFLITHNGSPDDITPFCTTTMEGGSHSQSEGDVAKEGMDKEEEIKDEAKEVTEERNDMVVCEVGNPLPFDSSVGLKLFFQPSPSISHYNSFSFDLKVNSSNPEPNNSTMVNNVASVSLPLVMKSDINIRGISWPDADFNYNASFFGKALLGPNTPISHENEVGPEVTHIYEVVNKGPSNLTNVFIYLLWPSQTLVGDPLLYLVDLPTVTPVFVQCDPVNGVNYLNLNLDDIPAYDRLLSNDLLKRGEKGKSRSIRRVADHTASLQLLSDDDDHLTPEESGKDLKELLSCGSTNCTTMACFTPLFKAGDNFIVKARSRLWVDTIEKLGVTNLKISSMLIVHSQPGSLTTTKYHGKAMNWNRSVTSVIKTRTEVPVTSMSWLIWFGSIVAGLLVLALLILLLWMLGFFKRRRPQDEAESELINRNGSNGKL